MTIKFNLVDFISKLKTSNVKKQFLHQSYNAIDKGALFNY